MILFELEHFLEVSILSKMKMLFFERKLDCYNIFRSKNYGCYFLRKMKITLLLNC